MCSSDLLIVAQLRIFERVVGDQQLEAPHYLCQNLVHCPREVRTPQTSVSKVVRHWHCAGVGGSGLIFYPCHQLPIFVGQFEFFWSKPYMYLIASMPHQLGMDCDLFLQLSGRKLDKVKRYWSTQLKLVRVPNDLECEAKSSDENEEQEYAWTR